MAPDKRRQWPSARQARRTIDVPNWGTSTWTDLRRPTHGAQPTRPRPRPDPTVGHRGHALRPATDDSDRTHPGADNRRALGDMLYPPRSTCSRTPNTARRRRPLAPSASEGRPHESCPDNGARAAVRAPPSTVTSPISSRTLAGRRSNRWTSSVLIPSYGCDPCPTRVRLGPDLPGQQCRLCRIGPALRSLWTGEESLRPFGLFPLVDGTFRGAGGNRTLTHSPLRTCSEHVTPGQARFPG